MNIFLVIILFVLSLDYTISLIADLMNAKVASEELPEEFVGYYDVDKYRKSQKYLKDNVNFNVIKSSFMLIVIVTFIVLGGYNYFDKLARSFELNSILTGLIFAGLLIYAGYLIKVPFSVYRTFKIEEKYGFNKTTVKIFVTDLLKTWFLTALIGAPIFAIILFFFGKIGQLAWLYCWIIVVLFQFLLIFIAPVWIMPLFNKFMPLEQKELKEAIEKYAKDQDYKIKGIYKIDGSRRSTKSNAFFTGFGKYKRIALFDTLIEKHNIDELVSILAHEVGHFKKKHILKSMLMAILNTGVMFYILSLFLNNKGLFEAFRIEQLSVYASIMIFGFLYMPINMIVSIIGNIFSRKWEYQADKFAVETYNNPDAMILALKKLSVNNLSNLTPHPFKVFLDYSHPPVLERIKAIRELSVVSFQPSAKGSKRF